MLTLVPSNETIWIHPHNIVAVHKSTIQVGTAIYTTSSAVPFLVTEPAQMVVNQILGSRLSEEKR